MGKDNDLSEEEKDNKVDVIAISVIISALVAGAVVFISGVSIQHIVIIHRHRHEIVCP